MQGKEIPITCLLLVANDTFNINRIACTHKGQNSIRVLAFLSAIGLNFQTFRCRCLQLTILINFDQHNTITIRKKKLSWSRLAGEYQWREFPVVITGNYRPGKYSKFWQSGKYWEIQNFRVVWAKICCNISINLSWQHIFLIVYVHTMQIKYKFHDWSMPEDTADDFWQTHKSFLIIYQVLFQHYISKHKIIYHLVPRQRY